MIFLVFYGFLWLVFGFFCVFFFVFYRFLFLVFGFFGVFLVFIDFYVWSLVFLVCFF